MYNTVYVLLIYLPGDLDNCHFSEVLQQVQAVVHEVS